MGLNGWCHGAGSKNHMNTRDSEYYTCSKPVLRRVRDQSRAVDEVPLLELMENKICAKRVDKPVIDTIN
jgi:hypothetical protein